MTHHQSSDHHGNCHLCYAHTPLGELIGEVDILDDPLLKNVPPQSLLTPPNPEPVPASPAPPSHPTPLLTPQSSASSSYTPASPPAYQPVWSSLPKEQSPARVTSTGIFYLPDNSKLCSLREVASGDAGHPGICTFFSVWSSTMQTEAGLIFR